MYVSAYPVSYSRVKSKKDLKQAVAEFNTAGRDIDFEISDMSIGSGVINLKDFFEKYPNHTLSFTNHPKRSWFALVNFQDGKVKVA